MTSCADIDESVFVMEETVSIFLVHIVLPDLMMQADPKAAKLGFPFDGSAGTSSIRVLEAEDVW
jgi:hypothetical protein